ncbi:MAG: hypothetical protein NTX53_21630 [candidate division WOR-3 bacterium]|nr:hypothetical protein [candidate division WOR-3 bacterium]
MSTLKDLVGGEVARDGEFLSLGLLSHRADRLLVTFYDRKYTDELIANEHIACVLTTSELAALVPEYAGLAVCPDPMSAFYHVHEYLLRHTDFYWRDFKTEISPDAAIHPRAYVAPMNVRVGCGAIVEPNATILEHSIIGEDAVIRVGAVVGCDDLESKHVDGKRVVVPHAGGVFLHDRVELQVNSLVARPVFGGFTEIGEDTKIGAHVHIAHNVCIGRSCYIAPCAIICGSTTIGDHVWIGPNASISSELHVGDRAHITLGAVVTEDVLSGQRVSGNFAIDHDKFIKFVKSIR